MITASILAVALLASAQAATDSASFDIRSDQDIRMDLSAGEYKIVGAADGKVRVSWSADDRHDAADVRVRFKNEGRYARLETDHTRDVRFVISVPSRSNLHIRLTAGELSVSGIEGNKDIGLTAGELRVSIGDPSKYGAVRSSVRIGEIHAQPFNVTKEGFFRGFHMNGSGAYSLRATVGVGEVHLRR
jgi:hypothetical protein